MLFLISTLHKKIDASSLGLFRILVGAILLCESVVALTPAFITHNFIHAAYHFPFELFNFLRLPPLTAGGLQTLSFLMLIASLGILTGLCFRLSAITYLLPLLYLFLYDKGFENDYRYLVLLAVFLLSLTNANRWPALNTLRLTKIKTQEIPYWQVFILRFQFIIVYIFSGISKLNADWLLRAQPMQGILEGKFLFGFSLEPLWVAYAFSWGGLIAMFTIASGLMFKPLRKIAFILILGFHLINFFVLFNDIGLFPILMIAGIIPFLEPDAPRNFFDKIFRNKSQLPQSAAREGATAPGVIVGFLSLYMAVQILVPLRQFLYPGNPAWTFEGARFAWRLKMNAKEVTMWIKARDPATGKIYDIYNPHELVGDQRWMDNMPDMILQYIQFKKETLVVMGIHAPVITVEAYARLNGRNPQPFIDKSVNLANYKYKFLQHADWIIPLKD